MKSIGIQLFLGLFYAVGAALLAYGLWSARRSTQAANWSTADGTLTSCSMSSSSDNEGTSYEVKVAYQYTVSGKQYTGNRIAFGYAGSSGSAAHQQILTKLQNAKSVQVRYDPEDPSVSTLSFGVHKSILFILAFAVTWLAFVIGFTCLTWVGSRSDDVLLRNLITR